MKRFFSLVIAFLSLSTYMLWAAGQPEEEAKGPVTLIMYDWENSGLSSVIKAFNAQSTDIKVDLKQISTGDYETKLLTILAGGVYMDIYMQKTPAARFEQYTNGFIAPLDKFIKSSGTDMSVVSAYNGGLKVNGKYVSVPYRGGGAYVYYNKKVFDAAGLPYPDTLVENNKWTWAVYRDLARKLTSGSGDGKVWGSFMPIWGEWQLFSLAQAGDTVIDNAGNISYKPEDVVAAFKNRKILEDTKSQPRLSRVIATKLHYSKAFYKGNLGMLIIGEWFPNMMSNGRDEGLLKGFTWDDWGVVPLPCDEKEYNAPGMATSGHVAAISKHKAEAFKVLAFLGLSDEGSELVAKAGLMPAYLSPKAAEVIKNNIPDEESLKYYLSPYPRRNLVNNKYGNKVSDLILTLMEDYLAGGLTDNELLKKWKSGLEETVAIIGR